MASTSTNFNTGDMKVCFFDVDNKDVAPLDEISMSKLLKAADYALHRAIKKNKSIKGFIVVNPGVVFGEEHFGALAAHFKKKKAKILSTVGDTLVLESEEEYIITIQMVGGARFVANLADQDISTDESDFEDVNGMGLTQECALGL
jgi:hypothetical protein